MAYTSLWVSKAVLCQTTLPPHNTFKTQRPQEELLCTRQETAALARPGPPPPPPPGGHPMPGTPGCPAPQPLPLCRAPLPCHSLCWSVPAGQRGGAQVLPLASQRGAAPQCRHGSPGRAGPALLRTSCLPSGPTTRLRPGPPPKPERPCCLPLQGDRASVPGLTVQARPHCSTQTSSLSSAAVAARGAWAWGDPPTPPASFPRSSMSESRLSPGGRLLR